MARRFWLMKVESAVFSIHDLKKAGSTSWDGVRNYQARNSMRDDFQVGDGVLFYHSSSDPSGVAGLAVVSRAGYPDATAFKKGHEYFDPKSKKDAPTWFTVDVKFEQAFAHTITLETLKATPGLEQMLVTRRGQRLSVMPVTEAEYRIVCDLARKAQG
ncbi:MAG: EVE domain-containing protein [Planctomycetes bacterium]|nr:EVE domain-containing protein [Planctomycetota bacterium]